MIPVIAIIGRPNVGKSTLFNYLTRTRDALVADEPGVTRDRQYGEGTFEDKHFIVIDTGGLEDTDNKIHTQISQQALLAITEADIIFWVTDARAGFTAVDQKIAKKLRGLDKPVYLLANKSDGLDAGIACAEFYRTGIANVLAITATQGRGLQDLLLKILPGSAGSADDLSAPGQSPVKQAVGLHADEPSALPAPALPGNIKVAIIGRPNAGKSTLVNRILGEERVVVYDAPGTTRDSIFIPFERRGKAYTLIDTAGVRRRRSIEDPIEKFSVVKTLQAIAEANVAVFVLDASEGLADQDLHLLGYILEAGRALVIAVNKWDGLPQDKRDWVKRELERRLVFVKYARVYFISALHGTGVGDLFTAIDEAYRSATRQLSTPKLTDILEEAVADHQPPAVMGRRIKLRYAHAGGSNPPTIIIHGNQTDALPDSYRRYLANYFREALSLKGTPLRIELRSGENPFKDKKNVLTSRQVKRRKRLIQHVKKK